MKLRILSHKSYVPTWLTYSLTKTTWTKEDKSALEKHLKKYSYNLVMDKYGREHNLNAIIDEHSIDYVYEQFAY